MKILLVEDDEGLLAMLRQVLASQHYLVECATDGLVGWELAETFDYDLILLDWTLPRLDGISFCQRLRAQVNVNAPVHSSHPNCNTPVILLTARDSSDEQVLALDAGADDYLVKPISPVELLARIRALLRRGSGSRSPVLVWGNLCLSQRVVKLPARIRQFP
jgi:DNA-binding response OmpR family regulator